MDTDLVETLFFRRCADVSGTCQQLQFGRRNGRLSVFLGRSFDHPPEDEASDAAFSEREHLFINLNPVERGTWRKILAAQSITSIAKEEGVSRAAIYARIQGNRFGQGGMIGKNFWVLLWWRLRQQMMAGTQ
jgi:hypothetical protein